MLILPNSAGQITNRDRFDHIIADGGATTPGAVNIADVIHIESFKDTDDDPAGRLGRLGAVRKHPASKKGLRPKIE